MLPSHGVSLKGIHPFVCAWEEERRKILQVKPLYSDRQVLRQGRYLLYVSSLAPIPVHCGRVFSLSPFLFPVYTQCGNSCRDFCSWQFFSSVPQSEHFSCRTSNSSTSGVLPVTQCRLPVHLLTATSAPYQPPTFSCKAVRES